MTLQMGRLAQLANELRRSNPTLKMDDWCTCAISFATQMPEFNLVGFTDAAPKYPRIAQYQGMHTDDAAALFFGLNVYEIKYLFYPTFVGEVRTGIQQAERIDHFIESNGLDVAAIRSMMAHLPHFWRDLEAVCAI